MSVKVKICGITNLNDAQLATELGTDYLGFNFYRPSPRYLEPKKAAKITANLPEDIITVGVFVNAGLKGISEVLRQCPLNMVQLHGAESDEDCRAAADMGVKVIKALPIKQPEDIQAARRYKTEAILLDAFHKKLYGGTGHRFDWSWIGQLSSQKVFLAGGITPENVTKALAAGTFGIDLCSGLERAPGIKDPHKMKKLFEEIKKYMSK